MQSSLGLERKPGFGLAGRGPPCLAPLLQNQQSLTAQVQAFILLVTTLVASIEACALLQTPFTPRATVRFSREC